MAFAGWSSAAAEVVCRRHPARIGHPISPVSLPSRMGPDPEIPAPEALEGLAGQPIETRNERLLDLAREGHFDFVDFGTHRGGGIKWGRRLGGTRGLGIELDPSRAQAALDAGFPVYTGDIATFPTTGMRFRFAVCRHILEHMPNEYVVGFVLWRLAQVCTEFIYIEQPIFDDAEELERQGLTLAQTTMPNHTCRLSIEQLLRIVEGVGIPAYAQGRVRPIHSSANPWVHVAGAAENRSRWREGVDPPKPEVEFDPPLYRDLVVFAALGRFDLDDLLARLEGFQLDRSVGLPL